MRGLSFTVEGELFVVDVIPVQKVARKLAITPVPSSPPEVLGIANLKGRVVTVLSLNKLLGNEIRSEHDRYVNTIVFKSQSGAEDQMGIAIEKPGNLIYIDNDAIRSPPVTPHSDEVPYISGVAEIGKDFYRMIDIESIRRKYTHTSDPGSINSLYGGTEEV